MIRLISAMFQSKPRAEPGDRRDGLIQEEGRENGGFRGG